jgi:hypothetical protein
LSNAQFSSDGGNIWTAWPVSNQTSIGGLAYNQTVTIKARASVNTTNCGPITNAASVSSTTDDPVPENNSSSASNTPVTDQTAPTITCPAPVTVSCVSDIPAVNTSAVTASDNCGGTPAITHRGDVISNQICDNHYTITRTYRATDANGNYAECSQIITVNDQTPPTITAPSPVTVQCTSAVPNYATNYSSFILLSGASVTNNCSTGAITVTHVGDAVSNQSCTNKYTLTRTYRATDGCGNYAECQQIITVNDNNAPTFTAPGNLSISCDQDYTDLSLTGDVTNEADNCGSLTLQATFTDNFTHLTGCNNTGYITRTWTLNDGCGNITTHDQIITIIDNTNPQITCPGNQTKDANTGLCYYTTVGSEFDPVSATDNCGVDHIAYNLTGETSGTGETSLAGIHLSIGVTNITWTVTDACGNTANCNFAVTVNDSQNPTIECVPNISRNVDASQCNATVSAADLAPASYGDNCTVTAANLSWEMTGATTGTGLGLILETQFNTGLTTVKYTITDASNNIADCSFTVRVTDNINPTITCAGDLARNVDAGQCYATVANTALIPTYNDNCTVTAANLAWSMAGATTGSGTGLMPATQFNVGNTVVTYTITDGGNNTADCNFNVTVTDNIDPVISCVANISHNVDPGRCNTTIAASSLAPVSYSDNCTVTAANLSWSISGETSGSGTSLIPQTIFNLGTSTITYTVTDGSGRTANCSFTVTITDNIDPTITCDGTITRNVDAGECSATVNASVLAPLAYSDNCTVTDANLSWALSGATTGSGSGSMLNTAFNVGTTVVTYTITDGSFNSSTASFDVVVTDNIDPVISCVPNMPVNVDPAYCYATVANTALIPTYSDNCPVTASNLSWTMTGATTDSGTGLIPTTQFNVGNTTITYTITDNHGRTASCSFTVTVTDNIEPTVTCPGNVARNVDSGQCNATISASSLAPVAYSDNCSVTASNLSWVMTGATTGSGNGLMLQTIFNVGTTNINYTITDSNGRTSTCDFNVVVTDNINPVITCVANMSLNVDPDKCYATVSNTSLVPVISDNCAVSESNVSWLMTGATTGSGTGYMPTTGFNTGTTIITYTITDAHGKTANCSFSVTVTDNVDPTISCASNSTHNVNSGECYATIAASSLAPNSYSDNCTLTTSNLSWNMTGATTGYGDGLIPQTNFNVGTTTIIYTIQDGGSRTASCSFTVTILDNIDPSINCVGNLTRNVDPEKCSANILSANLAPISYSDNCTVSESNLSWTMTGATADNGTGLIPDTDFETGITTIIYTITDASGRTGSCSFTVTVTDNIDPSIVCLSNLLRNVDNGQCYATIAASNIAPVSYGDNCNITSANISWTLTGTTTGTGNGLLPQTTFNTGITTVLYTLTDGSGRSTNCSFNITVIDNIDPTISCPSNQTFSVDPGQCNTSVGASALNPVSFGDNCEVTSANLTWKMTGVTIGNGTGMMPNTDFNVGTTTITYTITDAAGRSASCSFTVTVTDDSSPNISCPGAISVNVNINNSYSGSIGTATATDNCDPSVTITNNAPALYPLGVTTVTWTATDDAGNISTCSQTVTVTNQPPIAADDFYSVLQSTVSAPTSVSGNVLLNDIDPEDQAMTVTSWTLIGSGTISTNANGVFTYTPVVGGSTGTVTIDYTVTDACGQTDTGTVTIQINSCVMPPAIPGPIKITK